MMIHKMRLKMMSNEHCCNTCYKRNYCCGCNWYSDICNKDRSECVHKRMHEIFGDEKTEGDIDDKRKSE